MSKGIIGLIIGVLVVGFGITWFATSYVTYTNAAVELQNQASAKQKANEVVFDKVWKVLQQKAGVTEKYAGDFKKIYGEIMDKRYSGNDNLLFKFVTEANPNFSTALYEDLSRSIEANRNEFASVQTALIDIKREHDNLRTKIPSRFFLSLAGIGELKVVIVTSAKTDAAFKSGQENEVDLFQKQ